MGEGTARAGRKDADDNSARDAIEASVRPIPVCAGLALFALFLFLLLDRKKRKKCT